MSSMNNGYEDFQPSSYGTPSSFPHVSSYADLETALTSAESDQPRILVMGPRRCGKSSILQVVFSKMSPHETLFLESTNEIHVKEVCNNALVKFQILDFPGSFDFEDSKNKVEAGKLLKKCGALVFVIDGQDDGVFQDAIDYFLKLVKVSHAHNPKISYTVLIHKIDGDSYLSDDQKMECQREIQQQITDELLETKLNIHPNFFLTSIYDHTVFEAFSKVVQNQIPQLAFLENLLDSLIANCGIEKTFLFDVLSKIYVATDSNPVDMQTYELCSDMIDVVIDVSCIYGAKDKGDDLGAYDADSASVITMSNGYVLYLREVNRYLALVCLMQQESFAKSGLVEYNVAQFRKAISELFEAKQKFKSTGRPSSASLQAAATPSTAST